MVPPNSFGPPTMVAVVVDFKDRGARGTFFSWKLGPWMKSNNNLCFNVVHQGGGEEDLWEAWCLEAQARLALPTRGNL